MPDNIEQSEPVGVQSQQPPVIESVAIDPKVGGTANRSKSDQPSDGVITDYRVRSHYVLNDQVFHLPIASPTGFNGAFSSLVQLAAPIADVVFEWTASKVGSKPQAPSPYVSDPNCVFLRATPTIESVDVDGDGSPIFRFSGSYFYAFKNRSAMTVSAAVPPWVSTSVIGDNVLNADDFVSGITDAGWPNPAAASVLTPG